MTANTGVHTCSYYCERPECVRRQRDELRDRLESALAQRPPSAPVGVEEMQRRLDREESDHGRAIDQRDAAEDALGRMFQAVTGRPAEWSSAWGYVDAIEEVEEHVAALAQQPAAMAPPPGDGCHCGTCTCNPNMTPAVRFDLSPAQMEGAIRDHLIALGWTPPNTAPPPSAPVVAAESAEPAVWVAADTLNSPHPVCVSSLAYMSQLDRERGREYVPLYTATQQPAGVMPDGISDDVIKAVWRAAMTSAHNVCVNRSNRWNDDDGPDDRITEANECAKEIAHWLEADEGFIAEIRAALAAQQGGRADG